MEASRFRAPLLISYTFARFGNSNLLRDHERTDVPFSASKQRGSVYGMRRRNPLRSPVLKPARRALSMPSKNFQPKACRTPGRQIAWWCWHGPAKATQLSGKRKSKDNDKNEHRSHGLGLCSSVKDSETSLLQSTAALVYRARATA